MGRIYLFNAEISHPSKDSHFFCQIYGPFVEGNFFPIKKRHTPYSFGRIRQAILCYISNGAGIEPAPFPNG
ncbi:MAG: hypothetical protein DBY06_00520 [Clostridiales bacterium]|nr:MAG: hypothetical protein DBY06_00520 [Clostridiales bacterium]